MKEENLITWKIKYSCDSNLSEFIKQYNTLFRFTFNRLSDNIKLKTADLNNIQKSINNCDLMNSWFRGCAEYQARAMIKSANKSNVIFGGKSLFVKRCQKKISKEEFLHKRLLPLYSIGEANAHGNRLFQIIDASTILFKPNKYNRFILNLHSVGRNRFSCFDRLIKLQNQSQLPITFKLDSEYIYITFDYSVFKSFNYSLKQDRIFAIDLNPNSIGWTIVDWRNAANYHVAKAGTISLKPLNDYRNSFKIASDDVRHRYVTNKRNHEIIEIAKQLFNLCRYYHCELFAIEQLDIPSRDNGRGKGFNRLVNNMWNRNLLVAQIKKRIKASSTTFVEVQPQWNSYIGNLVFRKESLPDECLASIEIGRRGWEFSTQYIFNRRPRSKTVVFPELESVKNQLSVSLEEIGIDVPDLDDWLHILLEVKKSKTKYRFSSEEARRRHSECLFSKLYKCRYTVIEEYL